MENDVQRFVLEMDSQGIRKLERMEEQELQYEEETCECCECAGIPDRIGFDLKDGEHVEAIAVKHEEDGTIFCFVDCLKDEYPMYKETNDHMAYEKSDLRKMLNRSLLCGFPDIIRKKMVRFPNGDYIRIPTEKEIFGTNEVGQEEPDDVEQWEPMKLRRNRIAFQGFNGDSEWYWLQNKRDPASSSHFALVNSGGNCYYSSASGTSIGVRPAFKISNL